MECCSASEGFSPCFNVFLKEMIGTWGGSALHDRVQARMWGVCGKNLQLSVFEVFCSLQREFLLAVSVGFQGFAISRFLGVP